MAGDINKVIIIGRMVRDPELRHLQSGSSVTDFSIAVKRLYSVAGEKKEETSFINCTAWGKQAEALAQYCKKGQRIGVEGRLKQDTWDDKEDGKKRSKLYVVVENFQFLTPKSSEQENIHVDSSPSSDYSGQGVTDDKPFSDDDIPF